MQYIGQSISSETLSCDLIDNIAFASEQQALSALSLHEVVDEEKAASDFKHEQKKHMQFFIRS